jgi:hypothetical protein
MNQSILNRPKTDKFVLFLDIPKVLKDYQDPVLKRGFNADQIQFTVFGSPTPNISIPPVDVRYGGQNMYVSSHSRPSYTPLTVKFMVDNGYINYWILWRWLDLFNNATYSTTQMGVNGDIMDYTTNLTLVAMDEYNNSLISFKYIKAVITKLGSIGYDHQSESNVSSSVEFAFDQMHIELLQDINNPIC